jgi:hypothetical protein
MGSGYVTPGCYAATDPVGRKWVYPVLMRMACCAHLHQLWLHVSGTHMVIILSSSRLCSAQIVQVQRSAPLTTPSPKKRSLLIINYGNIGPRCVGWRMASAAPSCWYGGLENDAIAGSGLEGTVLLGAKRLPPHENNHDRARVPDGATWLYQLDTTHWAYSHGILRLGHGCDTVFFVSTPHPWGIFQTKL